MSAVGPSLIFMLLHLVHTVFLTVDVAETDTIKSWLSSPCSRSLSLFLSLRPALDSSKGWFFFLRLSPLLVSHCRHGCSSSSSSRPRRGRWNRQVRAQSRSRHIFLRCNHVFAFQAYFLSSSFFLSTFFMFPGFDRDLFFQIKTWKQFSSCFLLFFKFFLL